MEPRHLVCFVGDNFYEDGVASVDATHGQEDLWLGHARDYADVPPIAGNYRGTVERTMTVEVKITPVFMTVPVRLGEWV